MNEEEGRRKATVEALNMAEQSNKELKKQLLEEQKEKKSVAATLDNVEKQAESQRVLLRNTEDQLTASKTQIVALKKKLEEAEKAKVQAERARDQAEQDGYNAGVAETEEALRVEVSGVCRTYCFQTWYEALNQAGVETLSALRRAENVYYPFAIRRSIPSFSRIDGKSEVAEVSKDNTTNVTTTFVILSKEAERLGATKKEKNSNQVVDPDAMKPPSTSQDLPIEKEASKIMEIVLASLPLPAKPDLASKGSKVSEAATAQPAGGLPKEKICNKKRNKLIYVSNRQVTTPYMVSCKIS